MPADNSLGLNNVKALSPPGPNARPQHPEPPIGVAEAGSGVAVLEDRRLLPKHQILRGELSLIAQLRSEPSCHVLQPLHHGP